MLGNRFSCSKPFCLFLPYVFLGLAWASVSSLEAQTSDPEIAAIQSTLNDYIQGSTNGQPERLKKVFHPNLNLYSIRNGKLSVWSGKDYIKSTKEGQPTGENAGFKLLGIFKVVSLGEGPAGFSNRRTQPLDRHDAFCFVAKTGGHYW